MDGAWPSLTVHALLCMPCNMGIGYLGDDPDRLLQAAFYLERHKKLTNV